MPEEENIFEDAEIEDVLQDEDGSDEDLDNDGTYEEWTPTISDESPKAKLERKGLKNKAEGRVLTVKQWFFTRPKIKAIDGSILPPKQTQNTKKPFYPGKLGIKFEEDNLVEYYPTMRYFVNDGVVSKVAKLNRTGDSIITKLVLLIAAKIGKPLEELSDKQMLDFLVGKKVKITTTEGKYNKKDWFRNDIIEIL